MRRYIPWHTKVAIKIILARLPISYEFWSRFNLFKHGQMASADYAKKIFNLHLNLAEEFGAPKDGVYLEMGPGDSVASALLAAAQGAKEIYMVDVGSFATRDMPYYAHLARKLGQDGKPLLEIDETVSFEDMLVRCNAKYLTQGLKSLKEIPEDTIDFIWSHATLEHVRRYEFAETIRETFRVLKPGGIASHNIDLKDHLGGALNNLRFSEDLWESDWMVSSGFYTNRLQKSDILAAFEKAGFVIEEQNTGRWGSLPTSKDKMASPFCDLSDEELLVRSMSLIARRPYTNPD